MMENGLLAGGLSREARDKLVCCEATHDRLDRTVHEPWMALKSRYNCLNHDCTYYFNLRRAQEANLVFHDDFFFVRQHAGKRIGQGGHFCGRIFVRKETPDFNQAGGDSKRQNWLAHTRPTRRTFILWTRKKRKSFLLPLIKQVLKSPNKSAMINELIDAYSQTKCSKSRWLSVSHRDAESHTH